MTSIMTIVCQHLSDDHCLIAAQVAGIPCQVETPTCTACMRQHDPMAVNRVTSGLAAASLHKAGRVEDARTVFHESRSVYQEALKVASTVGDNLQELLKEKGVEVAECQCREWIDRMNLWGPEGCRENMDKIVDHLFGEATSNKATPMLIRFALNVPLIGEFVGRQKIKELVERAIQMELDRPTEKMSQDVLTQRLIEQATGWPDGWRDWSNVKEWHRNAVQNMLMMSTRLTSPEVSGRGILIPAGGKCIFYSDVAQPYFWCAMAAAYVLRYHGCRLPIQFWFLPGELAEIEHAEDFAKKVGATCHTVDTTGIRCLGGWQIKIHAIQQSGFAEVLHLDADNIVTKDPMYLFDSQEFKTNAALFWGDNPSDRWQRGSILPHHWSRLGVARTDTIQDIEAGQMLIVVRRGWQALQVAKHLADHADYWGGFNGGAPGVWYGDKTDFHVGFLLTKTPFWKTTKFEFSLGGFYLHRDPAGNPIFQHCCHRKGHLVNGYPISLMEGNKLIREAAHTRRPLHFLDGSIEESDRLIHPERHFEMGGDSIDRDIWMSVVSANEYSLPPAFHAGNVILDIGANVGQFAYACLRRSPGRVVSCEPYPDAVDKMRRNCGPWSENHDIRNVAVWRSDVDQKTVSLHPHGRKTQTTSYSVTLSKSAHDQWEVPCVKLDDLLKELGSVHILKLDCEGSEFPILYTSQELRRCEYIIGEYHQDALQALAGDPPLAGWPDWTIESLTDFLKIRGFEMYALERASKVHGGFWAKRTTTTAEKSPAVNVAGIVK